MINKSVYLGIPLHRRRNRRWLVVGYWAAALVFFASTSGLFQDARREGSQFWPWLLFGFVFSLLAMFLGGSGVGGPIPGWDGTSTELPYWSPLAVACRAIRRMTGQSQPDPQSTPFDERDLWLRNAAYYEAYKLLQQLVIPIAGGLLMAFVTVWSRYKFAAIPVFLLLILVTYNLPQSLILWFEPDMDSQMEGPE